MAIIRHTNFDKTVATVADRDAITPRVDNMVVVVEDSIADPDAGPGSAIYRWSVSLNKYLLMYKSNYPSMSIDTEELTIANGAVVPSNYPLDNQIWDIQVLNGDIAVAYPRIEDLTISTAGISGLDAWNGMKIRFTYGYGTVTQQLNSVLDEKADITYTDTQDALVLSESKTYTDTALSTFTGSGSGNGSGVANYGQWGYSNVAASITINQKIPAFTTKNGGTLLSTNTTDFVCKAGVTYKIENTAIVATSAAVEVCLQFKDSNLNPIGNQEDYVTVNFAANVAYNQDINFYYTPTVDTTISLYNLTSGATLTTINIYTVITAVSTANVSLGNYYINGKQFDSNNNIQLDGYSTMSSPVIGKEVLTEERHFSSGKPIYKMSFNFGTLPNNAGKSVPHGLTNLEDYWLDMVDSYVLQGINRYPISLATPTGITGDWYPSLDTTNIGFNTGSDRTAYTAYVTLKYTKSTDTAQSPVRLIGASTSTELPAYSTSETLTERRWIDGKPIYRKVYTLSNVASTSVRTDIDTSMTTNTVTMVNSNVFSLRADGLEFNDSSNGSVASTLYINLNASSLGYINSSSSTFTSVAVTVEYTKATDTSSSPIATSTLVNAQGAQALAGYNATETLTEHRWIDGKPIYRKVYTGLSSIPATTWTTIVTGATTIGAIISASSHDSSDTYYNPILARVSAGNLQIWSGATSLQSGCDVTIEYTKTSDTSASPVALVGGVVDSTTSKFVGFSAYQSIAQNISASTWTKLLFQNVDYDSNGAFTSSTYNIPVSGYYNFTGELSQNSGIYCYPALYKNGNLIKIGTTTGSNYRPIVDFTLYCNIGDKIELYTQSSSVITTNTGTYETFFQCELIAPIYGGQNYLQGYSTSETLTERRWIDGKPIYRKVYTSGINSTTTAVIDSTITNVNATCVNASIIALDTANNNNSFVLPSNQGQSGVPTVAITPSGVKGGLNGAATSWTLTAIVVEYTKVSDTSSSPIASISGGTAGYNITSGESLTGNFRNGKPIYTMEVDCGTLPNATSKTVAIPNFNSSYNYWIDVQNSYSKDNIANYTLPIPASASDSIGNNVGIWVSGNNITLMTGANRTNYTTTKVVLLYTK